MQCEICGKDSDGCFRIELEGSELIACDECAELGTKISKISVPVIKKKQKPRLEVHIPFFEKKPKEEAAFELLPDYGKMIRKEREKRGLTMEELGKILYIKGSELNRMEMQTLKPDEMQIKKIEKGLGIKLRTKASAEDYKNYAYKGSERMTLFDLFAKKK